MIWFFMGSCLMLAMSFLMTSKTSCNALGPNSYVLEWVLSGGGFLNSTGSSVCLGGLAILYSCLFCSGCEMVEIIH